MCSIVMLLLYISMLLAIAAITSYVPCIARRLRSNYQPESSKRTIFLHASLRCIDPLLCCGYNSILFLVFRHASKRICNSRSWLVVKPQVKNRSLIYTYLLSVNAKQRNRPEYKNPHLFKCISVMYVNIHTSNYLFGR